MRVLGSRPVGAPEILDAQGDATNRYEEHGCLRLTPRDLHEGANGECGTGCDQLIRAERSAGYVQLDQHQCSSLIPAPKTLVGVEGIPYSEAARFTH